MHYAKNYNGENMNNNGIHRFFGSGMALQCVKQVLHNAQVIRIATAYFEPSGYNLLRTVVRDKEVRLLVGRNEETENKKCKTIVEQFIEDLAVADIEDKNAICARALPIITIRLCNY